MRAEYMCVSTNNDRGRMGRASGGSVVESWEGGRGMAGWRAVGVRGERGRDSSAEPPTVLRGVVLRVAVLPADLPSEAPTVVGLP